MLFQPPLHKRILSRVVFYSSVVAFVLGTEYLQRRAVAESSETTQQVETQSAKTNLLPVGLKSESR